MEQKTFSDAIEQVMLNNGFYASLALIYKEFKNYREKTGKTPDKTIQEREFKGIKGLLRYDIEYMP